MQLLIWHRNVHTCLHEAYKFQRETLGPNHVSVLSTLDGIADLMAWNNETQSALENYKNIIRQLRKNENTIFAKRLNSLVLYKMHRIYSEQGDTDTAWKHLNEAQISLKDCAELDDESYELEKIIQRDVDKMKTKLKMNLNKDALLESKQYKYQNGILREDTEEQSLSTISTNERKNKPNTWKVNSINNSEVNIGKIIPVKESRQDDVDHTKDSMSRNGCQIERRDDVNASDSPVIKTWDKINTTNTDLFSTETRSKFAKFQKMYSAIQSSKTTKTSDCAKDKTSNQIKVPEPSSSVHSDAIGGNNISSNTKKRMDGPNTESRSKFEKLESFLANRSSSNSNHVKPLNNAHDSTTTISTETFSRNAQDSTAATKTSNPFYINDNSSYKRNEKINELLLLVDDLSEPKSSKPKDLPRKKDPRFAKYFSMLKAGMPKRVVKHAMVKDGIDTTIIDGDPNLPAKLRNEIEPAVLVDVTNLPAPRPKACKAGSSNLGVTTVPSNEVALKDDPKFTKFFKMLKVGMPRDIVKHAMKRDGYDSAILDSDPNLPAVIEEICETKPQSQPKNNVRRTRVHWDLVRGEVKSGSVWAFVQEDNDIGNMHIDDVEIKQLFEAEKSNNTAQGNKYTKDGGIKEGKVASSVKVIDPKRANNGGIILARVKISFDELARVVDNMEDSNLTQQQFQGIIEYLPTPKEIKSLIEYVGGCKTDVERAKLTNAMCECEKFMVAMMNVEDAEKKIRALIFRMEFDNAIQELEQDAMSIDNACSELSNSLRLRKLLGIVLNVGNKVNNGAARAFSITSLLKLNHAKSMDKKTTFLHYIVKVAKRNGKDILKFKEELPTLCKAEKISWEQSVNGVKGLEHNLKNIKDLVLPKEKIKSISRGTTCAFTKHELKTLSKSFVGQFVLEAALRIKHLKNRVDSTNHSYTKLLQYFHEEKLQSNEFFNIFVQFSQNVDDATAVIQNEEKVKRKKSLIKTTSITKLNSSMISMKDSKYRDKLRNKVPSMSRLNMSDSEESVELHMKKSVSHNYNSVITELKSWCSRKKQ